MSESQDPRSELSPAGEVFAEFLARVDDGERPDFEACCREHAEVETELRRLHARWTAMVEPLGALEREPEVRERELPLLNELPRDPRDEGEPPRYEDRGLVARGGMGEVREVWDRNLRRTLAMKVLLEGAAPRGSRGLVRFLEEAQITGQLDHPGIVPVHELGLDHAGRVFFTMPLIRGRHLGEVFASVRKGDPDWTLARALGVVLRVCEAVAFAHSKGVLHRDLKPANVMVGPFGETYVMDWGLAKVQGAEGGHDEPRAGGGEPRSRPAAAPRVRTDRSEALDDTPGSSLLTAAGSVVGTPAYLPPEQAAGDPRDVGPRSDVYSIGAMLYELLAGTKPYAESGTRSATQILAALVAGPPTPVHALQPDVPPELEAICEKAMAWRPADRYPDVLSLARDLRAFLEGRVVEVYETGALAELKKWVGRNRATAAASAAAIVLLLGGLASTSFVQSRANRELERKNQQLDDARVAEAEQARLAKERATDVLRLSDLGLLDGLEARAAELWPPHPDQVDGLQRWLDDAAELVARWKDRHVPTLAALREKALPYTEEEEQRDRARQPGYEELLWYRDILAQRLEELEGYEARAAAGEDSEKLRSNIHKWQESVEVARARLEPLEKAPFRRLTWTFATQEQQWEHDTLARLVERMEAFTAEDGLLADVEARRRTALRIGELSLTGAEAVVRWQDAIASIADPAQCPLYGGMEITPQVGLLPLGRNPATGLWEFAHLLSGDPAYMDLETGEVVMAAETGLVLVLVPGGHVFIGAQALDPSRQHYDPRAMPDESPVYGFTLDPYFLSRYEMTQAQWVRVWGDNPSDVRPGRMGASGLTATLLNPVESVLWEEATETCRRLGLVLPTEAQWERAARAGTDTPWFTGSEVESLDGFANLRDRTLFEEGNLWEGVTYLEWLDDGYSVHAPVGTYLPNEFGLYDMIGNVIEWCRDDDAPYQLKPNPGDGMRKSPLGPDRVARGGSFFDDANTARVSTRLKEHRGQVNTTVGLRPARALDP